MLGELLRATRTAIDTAGLFQALGYERNVRPFDGGAWVVAHWRGYQVVACDNGDPGAAARALAARLGSASLRALAVAVGNGQLAVSSPRPGARGSTRVQRLSLASPSTGAVLFLESLRPDKSPNALAHAIRLAELLSAESVSEEFYVAFRQVLERMTSSLGRARGGSPPDRRIAALLPLTRILFLYFIQAKGWLDGRRDYLRQLFDSSLARRRHFHRGALNPLFFGTLKRPVEVRSGVSHLGTIPYLNGGLFEPHPVERRVGPVIFSNEIWRDAFDLLFERFRFCVREADETDAIAPDMLGRVFERVMEPDTRRESGTFYTPETVVRQVVNAALETALQASIPRRDLQVILQGDPGEIIDIPGARDAIRGLRVLDPAVGSGAFLLGALERLTEIRLAVDPSLTHDRSAVRRAVLSENLFGIDLNPIAVRLAELRLWLAVIADDSITDIRHVLPLPNLDGVVRQGDSLNDPIGAARASNPVPFAGSASGARAVSSARRALFTAGSSLQDGVKRLRVLECALAADLVSGAAQTVACQLHDLAVAAISPDLFGRASRLSASQRARYRELLRHRRELRVAAAAVEGGQVPFFSFEIHLPEVMASGGFSIVVGNPPWVRAERLDPATRKRLGRRFSWWRGTQSRGYAHLPDVAVAFLERAMELVAPGGVVAMLIPAKLASAGYGEVARRHLVAESRIEYLHRVPEREASRFGATTYPLAIVATKSPPAPTHRVTLGFGATATLKQSRLNPPGPWILVPDRDRDALDELLGAGQPLSEVARPLLGVKTGMDDVFVGTLLHRHGPVARLRLPDGEADIEWELLRPAIRGRDVRPFRTSLQRALIWTHEPSGAARTTLPPLAAAWFRRNERRLCARADYRAGPSWTLFRVQPDNGGHQVVWSDIARRPAAASLESCGVPRAIPLNTCYTVRIADRETALLVTAVLNSVWCAALSRVTADEARGGYRRINVRVAGVFPIPPSSAHVNAVISLSADAHAHDDVASDDLDAAVAKAFGLSASTQRSLRSLAADRG